MTLLWLANANPAFKPFSELFTDQSLAAVTRYQQITAGLREFFSTRPPLGSKKQNLIDMLRAPALASPDSLSGQLAYIIEHWAELIGDSLSKLLLAIDVLTLKSPVAVAGSTLVAAALFSPLRSRVQQLVDRRFNRARYDAGQTVAAFAARLKDAVDLDAVQADLTAVVHQALEPTHVSVWMSQRD